MSIKYITTKNQVADILTKNLKGEQFCNKKKTWFSLIVFFYLGKLKLKYF